MNERMTICNMSIEAGAKAGMIAPDDTTYQFLAGRPFAPKGAAWDEALKFWRTLPSDAGAKFGKEVEIDAARVVPMVTWGTNPEQSLPITGRVPDPAQEQNAERRTEYSKALTYMGLQPGMLLTDIAVDRVFIGSCTNSRIDDIRAAAAVAKLGHAVVPAWIVPGSESIKRQAEAEGSRSHLHRGRLRMARRRLLALHCAQWRSAEARRALWIDLEQKLSGPAGSGRTYPSDEPGDGRSRGVARPSGRRARIGREELNAMEPFSILSGDSRAAR